MKIRKSHIFLVALTLAVIILASCGSKSEYYDKYKHYKYAYFPDYSTINNPLSEKDKKQAEKIISTATEVFTFQGEKMPEKDVGKLERYYRIDPYISDVQLSIEPIAGDFGKQKGFLWVVYSVTRLTESNETHSGSWDILSYWEVQKQEDESWRVVKIKEAA